MPKYTCSEPDVTIVSDKGQIVIPSHMRSRLGLKPRSKLLVYNVEDTIILKKLALPDLKREMRELWSEIDKKIAKDGEMSEGEINDIVHKYRHERPRKSKGA